MTTVANLPAGLDLRHVDAAADELARRLPEALRPLADIAHNYRWSWDPDGPALFERLDAATWERAHHNPVAQLMRLTPSRLDELAADDELVARVGRLADVIGDDLERPFRDGLDPERPVAFLCAEFGLHESMPQYSGGLGVLAGDIVKEASDLALPMVAVGLFYSHGYFQQRLDTSGWQVESWTRNEVDRMPVALVREDDGGELRLTVPVRGRDVAVRVWQLQVGRVPLYLLDTDLEENAPADRWTTGRLYDADHDVRLGQYATLGIGAVRLLDRLGVEPATFHMNEGHAAMAALELAAGEVAAGAAFDDALSRVRERCVFTTHTPVPAGNETYPAGTVLTAMPHMADRLGLVSDELLDLGRVHADRHAESGMTPIALRASRSTNGVSARHGEVARQMWQPLFGGEVAEVPITHVTNGVHLPTWMGGPFRALLDEHLGEDWWRHAADPAVWQRVHEIDDAAIWAARQRSRESLVEWVRERSSFDRLRRGEALEQARRAATALDPNALTLGFARRVATYKRLHLLTRDVERLSHILGGDRPVQLLIAGKAHPKDDGAKSMVRDLFATRGNTAIAERVVFLENYDIEVGRRLTTGCDVWLNVPRPPMEASGTSGMKVVLNGGLNLSVLDGWWAEGFDGTNGWGIDGGIDHDHGHQDHEHAQALLATLEKKVVPTFHDRGEQGVPHRWVAMVKSSLSTLGPMFAATRMMQDYAGRIYPVPSATS